MHNTILRSDCCNDRINKYGECISCGCSAHEVDVTDYDREIEERFYNDHIDCFVDDQVEAHNERTESAFENTFYEGTGND